MQFNHDTNLAKPAWVVVCRHSRDFHLGQAASVKRQFERQAGSDWDFVCLTDRPSEDWHLPLRTDWPGWWSVLEAFRLTGQPHVACDLDTLLYNDVRPLLRLAEDCPPSVLYGIRDLGKPAQWASGVTVWNGDWSFIADRFDPAMHPQRFRGNQDYTAWAVREEPGRHLGYLQDKVSGIVSYKYHLRGKHAQPPASTRIVCFHGKPRPWNVGPKEAPWVGEYLQKYAHSAPASLTMNTENHILNFGAVLWERDHIRVLEALKGETELGLHLRARHVGGVLELRESITATDIDATLRRHGVNLNAPVDLEVWRAFRHPERHRRGGNAAEKGRSKPGRLTPAATVGGGNTAEKGMTKQAEAGKGDESSPVAAGQATDRRLSPTAAAGGPAALPEPVRPVRVAPMFFRADGGTMDLADLYRGQTLFLVLNGSSLKEFDWDKLKRPGICSFGVNNGAHGFRPQFWTCVDDPTRFMESIWRDPGILKFVPQAHFDKPVWDAEKDTLSSRTVRDFPNVLGYRRNERFQAEQWLHEDTINWGNHAQYGGGRPVMLAALRIAYLLGFRRINLLGCDFQMDEKRRYWFDEERTPNSIRNNTNSYRILTGYFEQLKPLFDRVGFQVFNCNPDSQLKVFPVADLDTALREAEVSTTASTRGMYVDRFKPAPPPKEECREVLEPLLAAVNNAEVRTEPFVHLRLAQAFPDPLYRSLRAHLPEQRHYHELRRKRHAEHLWSEVAF